MAAPAPAPAARQLGVIGMRFGPMMVMLARRATGAPERAPSGGRAIRRDRATGDGPQDMRDADELCAGARRAAYQVRNRCVAGARMAAARSAGRVSVTLACPAGALARGATTVRASVPSTSGSTAGP